MLLEEVVWKAHYGVGSFPRVTRFVNEVVDLPWYGFTTYPKDSTLPRGKKIDGAGLEGVRGVVNLLCHVERVVNDRGQGAGRETRGWWRRRELSRLHEGLSHTLFGCVTYTTVK